MDISPPDIRKSKSEVDINPLIKYIYPLHTINQLQSIQFLPNLFQTWEMFGANSYYIKVLECTIYGLSTFIREFNSVLKYVSQVG